MENAKIGPLIRQLRKERDLTQKELAAMLNVTDTRRSYMVFSICPFTDCL